MRKYRIPILIIIVLLGVLLSVYFFSNGSDAPQLKTFKAARKEIQLVVNTNGIIEPIDRSEVYAPIDALVARIFQEEGAKVSKGQVLIQLESDPIRSSITDAKTALLEAKRQEKSATSGPLKEEIATLDAATAEIALQLDQTNKDLAVEESLLTKGAIARTVVDNLQKQRAQLQLRLDNQKRKKEDLLQRYSPEEKQWAQDKVRELTKQVQFLEKQQQTESVTALRNGSLFSLEVKPGAYVTKGQLLAQINPPGKVMLRAYVDEPDLGRIAKGQTVSIEWDGLPNKQWIGVVEKPAEQVVSLNNRTVGYVLCSIEGEPRELIPNLNVKVGITTVRKADALVVPRSAVFSPNGKPSVLLPDGKNLQQKKVVLGLVTSEEIEILQGINAGDTVIVNPLEVWK
jgi:HlyD family secretion protein